MKLTHIWEPEKGTVEGVQTIGNEWVYKQVFRETRKDGDKETEIMRFALWFVDPRTGEERRDVAPFYTERRAYNSTIGYRRLRWTHPADGMLVMLWGLQLSYDIGWHVLTYDGERWGQMLPTEERYRKSLVFREEEIKWWEEPGKLESAWVLAGGDFLALNNPLRFAVDHTHAFSYDSGPDTPRSKEYLAAQEELERLEPNRGNGRWYYTGPHKQAVLDAIPPEIRARFTDQHWSYWMVERDGYIVVTEMSAHEGIRSVMCFSE